MKSNEEIMMDLGLKFHMGRIELSKSEIMALINAVRIDTMKVAGTLEVGQEHYIISRHISHGRKGRYTLLYFFGMDEHDFIVYAMNPKQAMVFSTKMEALKKIDDLELEDHKVVKLLQDGTVEPIKDLVLGKND